MKRFNLTGKVGIVTGGNGGIGKGIARGLLECGAIVVIAGRNAAKNEAATADLSKIGPPVSAFVMDVTVEAECKAVVAETVRRHGRLDILVNNAGGGANTGVPASPPDEMAAEGFRKIIDANLTSTFMLSQAAYPEMKKAGGGKIINIGSMASYIGGALWTAYGPAKSGIVQLSKNCASASKDNIQVNTILPGYIDTDMTKRLQAMPALHERALARTAAGRLGTPDDFAGIAAFLASSASDFITGADIAVDGGMLWGI
ncbi:MAG: SDR family oxidoreductase [Alphaproteobacteria bacterium]|nr:MAG: SDR family oxidoreductase [Alphaproteobacteria bacterium]